MNAKYLIEFLRYLSDINTAFISKILTYEKWLTIVWDILSLQDKILGILFVSSTDCCSLNKFTASWKDEIYSFPALPLTLETGPN